MTSEAEFLKLQGARAKARLRLNALSLADEVLAPLQIRPFIRARPWWSLGGATAAGVLTGLRLGRRGGQRTVGPTKGKLYAGLASVSTSLRRLLRTAVGAVAMASLRGAAPGQAAAPPPMGDGAASAADDGVN